MVRILDTTAHSADTADKRAAAGDACFELGVAMNQARFAEVDGGVGGDGVGVE